MSLLDTILQELEAVTEAEIISVEPRFLVSQLDHVLGEANIQLRRLYCLLGKVCEKLDEAEDELRHIHDDDSFYVETAQTLRIKKKLLQEIFYASCIFDFPALFGRASTRIVLRKGWKVVWIVP